MKRTGINEKDIDERFDYTKWREDLFDGLSGTKISEKAMKFQNTLKNR